MNRCNSITSCVNKQRDIKRKKKVFLSHNNNQKIIENLPLLLRDTTQLQHSKHSIDMTQFLQINEMKLIIFVSWDLNRVHLNVII